MPRRWPRALRALPIVLGIPVLLGLAPSEPQATTRAPTAACSVPATTVPRGFRPPGPHRERGHRASTWTPPIRPTSCSRPTAASSAPGTAASTGPSRPQPSSSAPCSPSSSVKTSARPGTTGTSPLPDGGRPRVAPVPHARRRGAGAGPREGGDRSGLPRGLARSPSERRLGETRGRTSPTAFPTRPSRLVPIPGSPSDVHAVIGGQLWTSTDAGRTWRVRDPGIAGTRVETVALSLGRRRGSVAGVGQVYRSEDRGEDLAALGPNWASRPSRCAASPSPAQVGPSSSRRTVGSIYTAAGESWTLLVENLPAHLEAWPLVRDPVDRATLYAGFASSLPRALAARRRATDALDRISRRASWAVPPSSYCSGSRRRPCSARLPAATAHTALLGPKSRNAQRIPPGRRTWTDQVRRGRPSDR